MRARRTIKLVDKKTGETKKEIRRVMLAAPSGAEFIRWNGGEVEINSYDHEDEKFIIYLYDERDYAFFKIEE